MPFTQRATMPGMPAAGFGAVHPPCEGVSDGGVPGGVVGEAGAPEAVDGASEAVDGASGVASGTPVVAEG